MQKELRDRELFDAVMAHIEANPETHVQGTFGNKRDGTPVGCIAFWAVVLVDGADAIQWQDEDSCACCGESVRGVMVGDKLATIRGRARDLLGLNDWNADELFYSGNTVDDLYHKSALVFRDV